jgi:hypothetical protein
MYYLLAKLFGGFCLFNQQIMINENLYKLRTILPRCQRKLWSLVFEAWWNWYWRFPLASEFDSAKLEEHRVRGKTP